jgi:hypothetical protein
LQAPDLGDPALDPERLGKQVYLTVRQLRVYGNFPSLNATYLFLQRHAHKVPKCRQGRKVQVRRRDFDRAVAPTSEVVRHVEV